MWCRVALVITDISGECIASIIKVERNSELGTTLALSTNWNTLPRNTDYIRKEAIQERGVEYRGGGVSYVTDIRAFFPT
jgi:hypothetical protein